MVIQANGCECDCEYILKLMRFENGQITTQHKQDRVRLPTVFKKIWSRDFRINDYPPITELPACRVTPARHHVVRRHHMVRNSNEVENMLGVKVT